jgi:chromosome segregation and condensation protein ScpB
LKNTVKLVKAKKEEDREGVMEIVEFKNNWMGKTKTILKNFLEEDLY